MITTISLILFIVFLLSVGFGLYKGYSGSKNTSIDLEVATFKTPYFSFGVNYEGFEETTEPVSISETPITRYVEILSIGILWVRIVWEFEK